MDLFYFPDIRESIWTEYQICRIRWRLRARVNNSAAMLAHPLLLKAARIVLEWDQATLARNAKLSLSVITSLEKGRSISAKSWLMVQQALEDGGISFIPEQEDGKGSGLRVHNRLSREFADSDPSGKEKDGRAEHTASRPPSQRKTV